MTARTVTERTIGNCDFGVRIPRIGSELNTSSVQPQSLSITSSGDTKSIILWKYVLLHILVVITTKIWVITNLTGAYKTLMAYFSGDCC